ncbi:MAG: FdtA/QdtA family cupin domain-containing protein [Helicobacteraceae bacterium]|jgi:hypothetical protein|nr:FdtA/QdtA family cupin domain-containing protein [Helicobacteraceae bacterium]
MESAGIFAKVIELPKIADQRGNLSFFENNNQIPFEIQQTYWIYDLPSGESYMAGAHANSQLFVVALSGSFDILIKRAGAEKTIIMNRSYYGLYIPRMHWIEFNNFSTGALALVVSSALEDDRIEDYGGFCRKVEANDKQLRS